MIDIFENLTFLKGRYLFLTKKFFLGNLSDCATDGFHAGEGWTCAIVRSTVVKHFFWLEPRNFLQILPLIESFILIMCWPSEVGTEFRKNEIFWYQKSTTWKKIEDHWRLEGLKPSEWSSNWRTIGYMLSSSQSIVHFEEILRELWLPQTDCLISGNQIRYNTCAMMNYVLRYFVEMIYDQSAFIQC